MDKLKELVSFPGRRSNVSSDNASGASVNISSMISDPAVARYQQAHTQLGMFTHDPALDRELIDSIDQVYFADESDASRTELMQFVESSDVEGMKQKAEQLKRQHKAVSKRVSELVLQKHPDYAEELQRVMQLQRTLRDAFHISTAARRSLRSAAHSNLHSSVKVLLYRRRQQRLQALEATLVEMRVLCDADQRLKELLEEENFAVAIRLCQDCQRAAASPMYRGLACVRELSGKLQDTLVMTEESLDQAMCRMAACGFNYTLYDRIQKAYSLLGKSQPAFDQLHMHFTSTLHNAAFQIVLGYIQLGTMSATENFQKRQYQQLCSQLPSDLYLPCLSDLCRAVWEILKNYYQVLQYHHGNSAAASADHAYWKQKLDQAPSKLWQDVQSKIRVYLQCGNLQGAGLRFEQVIRTLHLVNRLVAVGQEFCGATSQTLQESIRKQILAFFKAYHSGRMETLRMFLENEAWHPVPVKPSFALTDLHEFRPFRQRLAQAARLRQLRLEPQQQLHQSAADAAADAASYSSCTTFFDHLDENPFDFTSEEDSVEDFFATPDAAVSTLPDDGGGGGGPSADSAAAAASAATRRPRANEVDDDEDEEEEEEEDQRLRAHHIDEETGRPVQLPLHQQQQQLHRQPNGQPTTLAAVAPLSAASPGSPLVTNTLLEVLRLLGRYTQMIHLLRPIAFDVVLRMTQLVEYYMYTVYWFFARDNIDLVQSCLTPKLKNCLLRIGDQLIQHAKLEDEAESGPGAGVSPMQSERFLLPAMPAGRRFGAASTPDAGHLAARIVSVESVAYLAQQMNAYLIAYLESHVPPEKKPFLAAFVSHTLSTVGDLRAPAACAVAATGLRLEPVQAGMTSGADRGGGGGGGGGGVNWDVREILSEHSAYVDLLLAELARFGDCLGRAAATQLGRLPAGWPDRLWHYALLVASQCLVEGFSAARRCSNEGRALMQLDFQHYLLGAGRLSGLRPPPHRDYVDQYIKAFYLPEGELQDWLRDRREYTPRQKAALVNCLAHLSRKTRQRLLAMLDLPVGGLGGLLDSPG